MARTDKITDPIFAPFALFRTPGIGKSAVMYYSIMKMHDLKGCPVVWVKKVSPGFSLRIEASGLLYDVVIDEFCMLVYARQCITLDNFGQLVVFDGCLEGDVEKISNTLSRPGVAIFATSSQGMYVGKRSDSKFQYQEALIHQGSSWEFEEIRNACTASDEILKELVQVSLKDEEELQELAKKVELEYKIATKEEQDNGTVKLGTGDEETDHDTVMDWDDGQQADGETIGATPVDSKKVTHSLDYLLKLRFHVAGRSIRGILRKTIK